MKITSTVKYKSKVKKKSEILFKSKKREFFHSVVISECNFEIPQKLKTPLQYFQLFFDITLIHLIVQQNNLYSVQKTEKSEMTNTEEI